MKVESEPPGTGAPQFSVPFPRVRHFYQFLISFQKSFCEETQANKYPPAFSGHKQDTVCPWSRVCFPHNLSLCTQLGCVLLFGCLAFVSALRLLPNCMASSFLKNKDRYMIRETLSACFYHAISSLQAVLRAWPEAKGSWRGKSFPLWAPRLPCRHASVIGGTCVSLLKEVAGWVGAWLGAGLWASGRPARQRGAAGSGDPIYCLWLLRVSGAC